MEELQSIQKGFGSLIRELLEIRAEKTFAAGAELLEMRWLFGEAIVKSPLFKRGNKAELYEKIGEAVNLKTTSLKYCVEFYQKYEKVNGVDDLLMALKEEGKLPPWRDIVHSLPSGKDKEICQHKNTEKVVRCLDCRKIINV